jgi:hypothetical protein
MVVTALATGGGSVDGAWTVEALAMARIMAIE